MKTLHAFLSAVLLVVARTAPVTAPASRPEETARVQRDAQQVIASTSRVSLVIDLNRGRIDLRWGDIAVLRGATASARVNGLPELNTANYDRHVVNPADVQRVREALGAGVRITVHHNQSKDAAAPELRQTVWVYDARPEIYTSLEVIATADAKPIASNHLAPIVVDEKAADSGLDFAVGDELQVLFVPFDNDEFVRYHSQNWSPDAYSHEVTALYDNSTRHGVVIGSVTHDLWKTAIDIRARGSKRIGGLRAYGGSTSRWTHDSQPHGTVRGTTLVSPRVSIGAFADWRDGMETYGRSNAALSPPLKWGHGVPFGWNSWAAHKEKLNAEHIRAAGDVLINDLVPAGFKNETAYLNLDAFWDFVKEEDRAANLARLHKAGLKAGIYWTPFASWASLSSKVEGTDDKYTYADIALKDPAGKPLPKLDGGQPLDPTHPGTRARNAHRYKQFLDWGYDFVKLDFMSHGALEGAHFDAAITTGIAAYNVGMRDLTAAFDPANAGRDVFLSLSIAPLFPSGYAHARRVSCDAFSNIGSTEYLLNSLTYAWWIHGTAYAFNDPDHSVVYRTHGESPVTEAEGRSRLNASIVGGGMLLSSDDMTDAAARTRVQAFFTNPALLALAREAKAFRPVEAVTGSGATDVFLRHGDAGTYLAAFNFDRKAGITKKIPLTRLGILPGHYRLVELWNGHEHALRPADAELSLDLAAMDSTLLQLLPAEPPAK